MKILALDIGAGTTDILVYDDRESNIENCVKMVIPSPSRVLAAKVRESTMLCKNLFIKGDIIGGGAFSHALRDHVEKGNRVVMTENSAYTVRNNLEEVRHFGIEVLQGDEEPTCFEGETLTVEEVNLTQLQAFLTGFGVTLSDVDIVAVAVQDHGVFPKGTSNRRFRIRTMRELLKKNSNPENLAFWEDKIPPYFLRMKSAVKASKRQLPKAKALVMDTSTAAILGCLRDPLVEKADLVLAVNVGNGHTMAAVISKRKIVGVMEHHTRLLNPQKIERLLISFADRTLTDDEVFTDNGHGLFFIAEPPSFSEIQRIAATGPNRNILSRTKLPVHFAAPAGDVMMTGTIGLVEASRRKSKLT